HLFDAACPGCGRAADAPEPCAGCRHRLERRVPPWCRRCGEPLLEGQPCSADHRALTGIDFHRAPFRYRGTGAGLVHRLKFQRDLGAGLFLARAMVRVIAPWAHGPGRRGVVVPVPRHRRKARRAGFDPAAWLAAELAHRLDLRVAERALLRTRETLPQADPRVVNREANVAGAFACVSPWAVAGAPVLLVDDVLTSGATARACAEALRAGGARSVTLVTGARA